LVQERNDIDLSTHDFIENINCSLVLKISKIDEGITEIGKDKFACNLTVGIYSKMIALIEPFCESQIYGYQWLYDLNTPIDFCFQKMEVGNF
jgi:hypothetical protein